MPPILLQAIIAGTFALIGAIIGALLSPTITFWLNDKTRKIDLYKSVYPIRLEAARALMEQASVLFHKVHGSRCGTTRLPPEVEEAEWNSLEEDVKKLESMAWSSEWLLGIAVKNATADFVSNCYSKIRPSWEEEDGLETQAYGPAYRALGEVVGRQIHLPELQQAVEPKPKRVDPLSQPREG